jgi:hypothetical protein
MAHSVDRLSILGELVYTYEAEEAETIDILLSDGYFAGVPENATIKITGAHSLAVSGLPLKIDASGKATVASWYSTITNILTESGTLTGDQSIYFYAGESSGLLTIPNGFRSGRGKNFTIFNNTSSQLKIRTGAFVKLNARTNVEFRMIEPFGSVTIYYDKMEDGIDHYVVSSVSLLVAEAASRYQHQNKYIGYENGDWFWRFDDFTPENYNYVDATFEDIAPAYVSDLMPKWSDKFIKYTRMFVGVDTSNGFELGRIEPITGETMSITAADIAAFSINPSTGMITLTDASLLTAAGTVNITVTGSIRGNFVIPIPVLDDDHKMFLFIANNGSDSNDGLQPHKPKLTPPTEGPFYASAASNSRVLCFRRGDTFVNYKGRSPRNGHYIAYGDPASAMPHIIAKPGELSIIDDINNCSGCLVEELRLDCNGTAIRAVDFSNLNDADNSTITGDYLSIRNCHGENNKADTNAALFYITPLASGRAFVSHCTFAKVEGESLYFRNAGEGSVVMFNDFPPPASRAGDTMQMARPNSGVATGYVSMFNIHRNSEDSASLKGAVASVTQDSLFYGNVGQGKYFFHSLGGDFNVMFNQLCYNNGLRAGDPGYGDDYALGVANEFDDQDSNIIIGNVSVGGSVGLIVSSGGGKTNGRSDMVIRDNVIYNARKLIKWDQDGSGLAADNIGIDITGELEDINAVRTDVPGTVYSDLTLTGNVGQTKVPDLPTVLPTVTGSAIPSETITCNAVAPVGGTVTIQLYLNWQPVSGQSSTNGTHSYNIPSDILTTSMQANAPEFLGFDRPVLMYKVTIADSDGNKDILWATWASGHTLEYVKDA